MRIAPRWPLFLLALSLPLAGCSNDELAVEDAALPKPTGRVAMLMGGWPHAKTITETGKATAYRIERDLETGEEKMLGAAVALRPGQRTELIGLLSRDDAYGWDIAKGCEPMPGVLITFEDGATYARLRICFGCQMLGYTPGGWEDFDPINGALIAWVKGVFPNDRLIQKLGTPEDEGGL
ncbi:MAG: hypothetical protein AAF711_09155 [Planctomycetota bacterium]